MGSIAITAKSEPVIVEPVVKNGLIPAGTPLITTVPYCYEAFDYVNQVEPRPEWVQMMESTAKHAFHDYKDTARGEHGASCGYTPTGGAGVVNASAYRAFLLAAAWRAFGVEAYREASERNIEFVLGTQHEDGSWPYAVDGVRDFVDHFHTCFVMKALAKIFLLTGEKKVFEALGRGLDYYQKNLFDADGMPRPFSKAPRLTVYKCELYDCAEAINLCLLLRKDFPALDKTLETVISGILNNWLKPDGSFRSRKLISSWDNVPMHRWAQSQMFRSLAFYLREENWKL